MSKKNVSWVIGGAAAITVAGAGLFAYGLESQALTRAPVPQVQNHVLVAQAETTSVSYTAEQAERGKTEFNKECVECHGQDLRGGLLGGPPLRGVSFLQKYGGGSPAGVLYEVMSSTMPPNAPGSYSPTVYADLMAHILKTNGVRSGSTELPSDIDALYELTIDK
ncbi:c-type cytochrome [Devosia ginsengisoli]|uniref:c-type cytochrome n=1 Tax=Devosia ginsengisoli TaxID=400770 RepID=UPI0026EA8E97|nr:c-type cytochrome [Devosia ginsengisoli]MCR6670113.1 cytochrome c [Devosia ginsengisoli]